jgi:transcriptional regulator with XRE-family HTH domain
MEISVNQRIIQLRNYLGLTQQDFADRINATQATIWRLEAGKTTPRQKTLSDIANIFHVNRDWLINGIGEMSFSESEEKQEQNNPWKEALVSQLKEENSFLRKQLNLMEAIIRQQIPQVNFNTAFGLAGQNVMGRYIQQLPKMSVKSVRVAA